MILQRDSCWNYMEALEACLEPLDFSFDNFFRVLCFILATGEMRGNHILQIVNVIDEDAVELVHRGINIARNGDINEEHGSILPPREKLFAVFAAEDRNRSTRRGNDD